MNWLIFTLIGAKLRVKESSDSGFNPLSEDSLTHSFANSEEPDEIPHHVTFHQGLHCLKPKS